MCIRDRIDKAGCENACRFTMKFAFAEERVCERSCIPTARNGRNLRDRITEPGARKVTDPNPGLDGRGFPLKRVAGEFDEAVGQRIGLTVEAHEREIPLDGASLDLDHTHFTAAQLLENRHDGDDGYRIAVEDE